MVSWRWLVASSLIAFLPSGCAKHLTSGEIAKQVGNSVVLITYADAQGNGSGFFVSGENKVCTVLTARHVVAPSNQLKLQTNDRKFWNSATIQNFPNQDLALITFDPGSENCPYKALELGDSDTVNVGDGIYITGFPGGSSAQQFVPGTVSALGKLSDGYGISYPVITAGGMSGGPVVNTAGKIIAVHGRSERELIKKAELTGGSLPPEQQSAQSVNSADGDAQNTFKWGIPSNTYKVNLSKMLAEAAATTNAEELLNSGNDLFASERYKEAVIDYDKAIQIKPDYHEAWYNRGIALRKLQRYQEAIASYDKAIQIKPDNHEAWNNRGNALDELKQYQEAIASYDKAIQIKPDNHEAWYNRGLSLGELKQYEQAITSWDKAIQFKRDVHEAWYNRGNALRKLQRDQEAIASYDKAIQFKPDDHTAWYNRGNVLGELQQYQEAIASYDKAIQIKPDLHEAWTGRGIALVALKQYQEAIASYDKAIQIKPDYQLAINNRKELLTQLGRSK